MTAVAIIEHNQMNHFIHTIRFRIILSFGICAALMLAIGLFGIDAISKLRTDLSVSYSGNLVPTNQLSRVHISQSQIRRLLWQLQATQDKEIPEKIRKLEGTVNAMWSSYYPSGISSDAERAVAERIQVQLGKFKLLVDHQLSLVEKGAYQEATEFQRDFVLPAGNALGDLLDEDIDLNVRQSNGFVTESANTSRQMIWITVALLCMGGTLMLGTSLYLFGAISTPLTRSVGVAKEIADGRLDNRIVVDTRGEFAPLLEAMQRMSRQLADTVRGIRASSESVTTAAREIAAGNMDLSARTEEQASSLEETAASMTEIAQTVKQNADNARQANSLATSASGMADDSHVAMQAMMRSIGNISESSGKIADITTMIEGISFQTNILALNAAVEAARAGEQGRGFAVVAGEVRALAQRSAAAAKEIKDLIDASTVLVNDGSRQAAEVGTLMGQVIRAIKQVADIVGEISSASHEQSQGIDQVHQAISQIDSVTQQNAALVEQAAAAAQSLEEQAVNMSDAISTFHLPAGDGVLPAARRPLALTC